MNKHFMIQKAAPPQEQNSKNYFLVIANSRDIQCCKKDKAIWYKKLGTIQFQPIKFE